MRAADAELELAAAVERHTVLLAVRDRVEQPSCAPEARRLDVQPARLDLERQHVLDRVDRRVEAQAVGGGFEDRPRLVGEGRILDHRVREALDDVAVQPRVGRLVDDRAAVIALEVGDADPTGGRELVDQRARPRAHRVDLELQRRLNGEEAIDVLTRRDDEADRAILAPDCRTERCARLSEREVERRALEAPAPVAREVEGFESLREIVERPRA